jgi:hypothetical protein
MDKMKRYDLQLDEADNTWMDEDPEGDYLKVEDVRELVEAARNFFNFSFNSDLPCECDFDDIKGVRISVKPCPMCDTSEACEKAFLDILSKFSEVE